MTYPKVSKLIAEYNRESLTVWGSLSNTNGACYLENKEIPFFMPIQHSMLSFLSWSVGLHWAWERWIDRDRFACVIFPCARIFLWKGWYCSLSLHPRFERLNKIGISVVLFGPNLNSEEGYERNYDRTGLYFSA
jgi:hypothetical protein